tara:strand:+ start:1179 stop:1745 length:567 start_codon:yes stop_codon:yes gene_type:complete
MVLLNFSFTGENSTGAQAFTLIKEYKFKTCLLKDIKYTIAGEDLFEQIGSVTSADGQSSISTTISSPLAIKMDFLDSNDCVLYSLKDGTGAGEAVSTVDNITGVIPFGVATGSANGNAVSDASTVSHSYPYTLIHNRPQTWASGKVLTFSLYYRDVRTDGLVKQWALMSGLTDAFNDMCSIDITLELL